MCGVCVRVCVQGGRCGYIVRHECRQLRQLMYVYTHAHCISLIWDPLGCNPKRLLK